MTAMRIICVVACALSSAVAASRGGNTPNILLILADDVGREVLGCYGGTSYRTPNIDRLAAGGVRFEHAYAMAVCHPTRTTLLTGQYPFRLGYPEWGTFPRDAEKRTLPAVLKAAGYATAVGGKWQLALLKDDLEQPRRMGFDEYCLYGWHEGPWYYQPHIWHDGKLRTDVRERFGPDVICEFVIDFIERYQDTPFFAFYSMSLCHAETNDLEKPAPVGPNGRYDSYAEMAAKMDERVGRVVAVLDRLGLRENTLIIYTTDNGTAAQNLADAEGDKLIYEDIVSKLGEREIPGGKATLTDWGTRVPLIVNWPGKLQAGKVSNQLTDMSDMLPTLADVAGATPPSGVRLDGRSLKAQMCDGAPPRGWVFAEREKRYFVRNQGWKLYNDGQFFDMERDPDEERPLPDDALPSAASAARSELQQSMDELKPSVAPSGL
jgi:arylsulfatase A-like enzyme